MKETIQWILVGNGEGTALAYLRVERVLHAPSSWSNIFHFHAVFGKKYTK